MVNLLTMFASGICDDLINNRWEIENNQIVYGSGDRMSLMIRLYYLILE